MEEYKMLLIVLSINILLILIVLVIFHYFRRYRKDKLVTQKYNTTMLDDENDNIFQKVNEFQIPDVLQGDEKNSKVMFHKAELIIKELRKKSKDYTFFGWFKFISKLTDSDIFSLCNREGLIYLLFLRTIGIFFLILSVISIFAVLPTFIVGERNSEKKDLTTLQQLTVLNIKHDSFKITWILFLSFFYVMMAYYLVYYLGNKMKKIEKKAKSVDSIDSDLSSHTLHIRGLARNLSFMEAQKVLKSFFDIMWGNEIVQIQVISNYDRLMEILNEKYSTELYFYQAAQANLIHPNMREKTNLSLFSYCSPKLVDSEIYYQNKLRVTENMLNFYRKLNSKTNTGNAFISFKSRKTVQDILDSQEVIFEKAHTFHGQILKIDDWIMKQAPTPSDIIWENIKYTKKGRVLRIIIYNFFLTVICMLVITPAKIKNELSSILEELNDQLTKEKLIFIKTLIDQYHLPLIVVFMNSLIVPLLVYYISLFEKHYKRSYREKSILVKNFIFMMLNSLFIATFGLGNFEHFFKTILSKEFTEWNSYLESNLLKNCYFFMRYMVQVAFLSNSIQLLALPQYLMKRIRIFLATTKFEEHTQSLIKKYFDYGYNYSFSLTVFCMTLIFSTTIPLITPFGSLFFFGKYYVDKYNLIYVYPTEFESDGEMGYFVLEFLIFGIFLFQFLISGLIVNYFDDDNKWFAFWVSMIYLVLAYTIHYVCKLYIFKEIEYNMSRNSFFEIFKIPNSNIISNFFPSAERSENRSSVVNADSEFEKIMRNAYVHPAEKTYINNPIAIWNDSYSFVKGKIRSSDPNEFVEYESIIKKTSNMKTSLRIKKGLLEDFVVE